MALIDDLGAQYPGFTPDEIVRALQTTKYKDFSFDEVANAVGYSPSDLGRRFKESFQQLPMMAYGAMAGAGAVAEKVAGEGGLATGVKKAGVEGFERWGDKIAEGTRESDSLESSLELAKQGDFGSLVDWFQGGLGYVSGQAVQALATAGVGSLAGKALLQKAAGEVAKRTVAKTAAEIAATKAGAKLAPEQVMKLATQQVASRIGQYGALGAAALGQEGGSIFGDLIADAEKEGREVTNEDLLRAGGATVLAGGAEFIGDKLALDVILGRTKLFNIGDSIKGATGRVARGTLGAVSIAPAEGLTEYVQTGLERYGSGKETTPLPWMQSEEGKSDAFESSALGVLGGGVIGGAGGLMSRARERRKELPQPTAADVLGAPDLQSAVKAAEAVAFGPGMPPGTSVPGTDTPFGDRLLIVREQLADPRIREQIRERFGNDGLNDADYYAGLANTDKQLPDTTRDRILGMAEAFVFQGGLSRLPRDPEQLEGGAALPQLEGPTDPLRIGMDNTPTGAMRVDSAGNVIPETLAQRATTRQQQAERESLGTGVPRGAAPDLLFTGDGQPYGTRSGAFARARRDGGTVVSVPGGWAVQVAPDQGNGQAASGEGLANRSAADAGVLRDLTQSATFQNQGLGGLDVPSQRVVLAGVLRSIENDEVVDRVVQAIPVVVMNKLFGRQGPSKSVRDNRAVLKNALAAFGQNPVAANVDVVADSIVRAVASVTAESSAPGARPVAVAQKLDAAADANETLMGAEVGAAASLGAEQAAGLGGQLAGRAADLGGAARTLDGRQVNSPTRIDELEPSAAGTAGGSPTLPAAPISERVKPVRPMDDARLQDPQWREELEFSAADIGWTQRGGSMIRDPNTAIDPNNPDAVFYGDVVGRTPWLGSDLWRYRPTEGGRINEDEARDAIKKALAGEPMNTRQRRYVQHVLDYTAQQLNEREQSALQQLEDAMMEAEAQAESEVIDNFWAELARIEAYEEDRAKQDTAEADSQDAGRPGQPEETAGPVSGTGGRSLQAPAAAPVEPDAPLKYGRDRPPKRDEEPWLDRFYTERAPNGRIRLISLRNFNSVGAYDNEEDAAAAARDIVSPKPADLSVNERAAEIIDEYRKEFAKLPSGMSAAEFRDFMDRRRAADTKTTGELLALAKTSDEGLLLPQRWGSGFVALHLDPRTEGSWLITRFTNDMEPSGRIEWDNPEPAAAEFRDTGTGTSGPDQLPKDKKAASAPQEPAPEAERLGDGDAAPEMELAAQSEADLRAKAEREAAAEKAERERQAELAKRAAAAKRARDKKEADERKARALKDRADAAVEGFQLGQEAPSAVVNRDDLAGQGSVFDAPAEPEAPAPAAAPEARRAPRPFEPQSTEIEHRGKTYRITVDRYWKIDSVADKMDPDLLSWTAQIRVDRDGASWLEAVAGDDVPLPVAKKASAFFANVRSVDAGEGMFGDATAIPLADRVRNLRKREEDAAGGDPQVWAGRAAMKAGQSREAPPELSNPDRWLRGWDEAAAESERTPKAEVDAGAAMVDPDPSPAQIGAENYRKGRTVISGMPVAIETAKGGVRRSKPDATEPWEVTMPAHYGDIEGTKGADGDPVDIFIGDAGDNGRFWVINQTTPDGKKFDEHKVITGVKSEAEAVRTYKASFAGNFGDKVYSSISQEMTADDLRALMPALAKTEPIEKPPKPAKRPPKSFRKKVEVTTPIYIEDTSTFEPRNVDADAALSALDSDIEAMRAFLKCLKGA